MKTKSFNSASFGDLLLILEIITELEAPFAAILFKNALNYWVPFLKSFLLNESPKNKMFE
ncbi:hypothetical protein ONA24_05980 [Mycoplasmopsis cynos]|uniref:Uncharacterized protein n=1 Tax=Mycoplasmopsis cynos (strain C142) TaxID=1246955 RepID=L0RWE9_MYCC1|nr:hypothetical protein [Mycoplasmopsis cynos]CCP23946.1 Hypothetical protein MCYN_0214 [Mycoplasmopsis cynos C142]UWV83164.1 hypothetical protein NW067_02820 [Mycoplasmopsis cynos]UWV93270.1 hypothetical protein NW062_04600 [Mycoplasmopsis cynos]WAM06888.1 hypothetical protein ONA23_01485 [Mycoplasmopsis cynos]WAM09523.1 hypothetical protein ONA24_05980 [Mycoplasmopsis cynos]